MPDLNKISLSHFEPSERDTVYKILILQKLCPEKFRIEDPDPFEELDDEDEYYELRYRLIKLMPRESIIFKLREWNNDFLFEICEDNFFDVALGSEEWAIGQAEDLKELYLFYLNEAGADCRQDMMTEDEFDKWILEECISFIKQWRQNIYIKFLGK